MSIVPASARSEAKGVKIWPMLSVKLRFQFNSADKRLYVPGTPRSRQFASVLIAVSAVLAQVPLVSAVCVIGSKLACSRLKLVKLIL